MMTLPYAVLVPILLIYFGIGIGLSWIFLRVDPEIQESKDYTEIIMIVGVWPVVLVIGLLSFISISFLYPIFPKIKQLLERRQNNV